MDNTCAVCGKDAEYKHRDTVKLTYRCGNHLPLVASEYTKLLDVPIYKSENIKPVCILCGKLANYEYRQNLRNPNNPKRSEYKCKEHRNYIGNYGKYVHEFWDEIDLAPDKPVFRYNISPTLNKFRVPNYKADTFNHIDVSEVDNFNCDIYLADSVSRSDGVRVTFHECEAHWVIVTWVPEASQ